MFDRRAGIAFIVLCITLLGSAIGFQAAAQSLTVFLRKQPVEMARHFSNIPNRLSARWMNIGQDRLLSTEIIQSLGTEEYLNRTYADESNPESPRVDVHVAYYTGVIDTVPHVPDRCFVAGGLTQSSLPSNHPLPVDRSGWRADPAFTNLATGEPYQLAESKDISRLQDPVHMPVGEFRIRVQEFVDPEAPEYKIFGGYYFIANGRVTPSPADIKRLAFRKSERYAYYCKIQFTVVTPASWTLEQYLEHIGSLNDDLLPELMLCLPDWAEVERRDS